MKPEPIRSWGDYFIPGTRVLKNLPGIQDQQQLTRYEEYRSMIRLMQISANPIPGKFDYEHMKAIHRHLLQDIYEWAGQERVAPTNGPMTKQYRDVVNYRVGDWAAPFVAYSYYPAGPALTSAAQSQFDALASKGLLVGLDRTTFVRELAQTWGELNTIHSFREGNTRTQFVFFTQLARNAGYDLDAAQFRVGSPLREEFVAARFYSQATGRNDRLANVLSLGITRLPDRQQTSTLDAIRQRARQLQAPSKTQSKNRPPQQQGKQQPER